jgi:glutathione S-transferase
VACLQYLADRYGPTDLSVKPEEPAYPDYLQFLVLGEGGLAAPLNAVIGTVFFGPEDQRGGNWTTDMVKEGYRRRMRLVTDRLAGGHAYLAGGRFTAADISVGYAVGLGKALGMAGELPAEVLAYHDRLTARPAFQRAAAVGVAA